MTTLYVDALFVLNLAVNYLLLLATAKISAIHISRLKIAGGALLGALYAVLAFFPQFGFLLLAPMRLVSGISMVLVAFGAKRRFLRICLIFFAVSAAFGGLIFAMSLLSGSPSAPGHLYIPINPQVLVISFLLCYFLMSLVFSRLGRDVGSRLLEISITRRGKTISCKGLLDTGHTLSDPMTGAAVLVIETDTVLSLFSDQAVSCLKNAHTPIDCIQHLEKTSDKGSLYLIPYTSVGVSSSFLLAFRPDILRIDGKETRGISVALSPTQVSDGGRYAALVGMHYE